MISDILKRNLVHSDKMNSSNSSLFLLSFMSLFFFQCTFVDIICLGVVNIVILLFCQKSKKKNLILICF